MVRRSLALVLVLALALAGCAAPAHTDGRGGTVAPANAAGTPATTGPPGTTAGGGGTGAPTTAAGTAPTTAPTDRGRIVTRDATLSTDPERVLARVERLRGLRANRTITITTFEPTDRGPIDVPDRVGYLTPTATRALQLSSSARVETYASPGITQSSATGVRVRLLNDAAVREEWNVSQEAVLSHELVHALQFQGVGYFRPTTYETTDAYLAALAMYEGDAVVVSERYADRYLDGDTIRLGFYNRTWSRPLATQGLSNGAYAAGYRYFRARNATPAERTAAIRSPPSTTARVLHPDATWNAAPLPTPVDTPAYALVRRDRPGELVLRQTLRVNGLGYRRSVAASTGWRNGSLYYYSTASSSPVHWVTEWASPAEARQFAAAWRATLDRRNATRADGLRRVPATATTGREYYAISRKGSTVHVTAGDDPDAVRGLADAWRNETAS